MWFFSSNIRWHLKLFLMFYKIYDLIHRCQLYLLIWEWKWTLLYRWHHIRYLILMPGTNSNKDCGSWQEVMSILSIFWSSKTSRNLGISDEKIIRKQNQSKIVKVPPYVERKKTHDLFHITLVFTKKFLKSLFLTNTSLFQFLHFPKFGLVLYLFNSSEPWEWD